MPYSIAFHLLAVVVWVGGMFFAYNALRPAAAQVLEPPLRLALWIQVFHRFFLWVWLSIFVVFGSGYWMLFQYFGGFASAAPYIHIMHSGAIIMLFLYLYVFFSPFRALQRAVIIKDFPQAGRCLNKIRILVGINTVLGLLIIVTGSAGRYL